MSKDFLADYMEHVSRMKRYGMYRDEEIQMNFKKSGHTHGISGELFDGCELDFDPEFGVVTITARGYEVIIELGNTDKWKTTSDCGGFDEALRVIVKDEQEWDEDLALKDFKVPVIEKEGT